MCSIIGFCGSGVTFDLFKECFDKTKSRGPDDSRITDTGKGLLGFHRLAIMGLTPDGMQPFKFGKSYAVCNGEIYGFESLKEDLIKKGYSFVSGSDCEILLPLYKEYGTDMFKMLDAEYALIIYDGETEQYIAARDPIGIRPLYYGYSENGTIIFASEPKNLVKLVKKIMPFPPGHYYKGGKFICYCDITRVEKVCHDSLETVCKNIREKLVAGIDKRLVSDANVGFLLSGGLDSSLVCAVAQKQSKSPIKTFAIGMSEDAIDLKYAKQVADYIGSDHTEVIITKEMKLNKYGKGKYLLRHAFEGDYLPHDILYREKAAFSDAVGHSMVDDLKEYAESCYTDEEFAEKKEKYTHAKPFTKESLLYREIFEKYYEGQSEMVKDFWMPNKEWEGCNVDDPSARVLSNYGASGQ